MIWLYRVIGGSALGLAAAGIALPLLPTTPFLLVAAWAFGRSSARLHAWLYDHRHFGPPLRRWRDHGAIPRPAKAMALLGMTGSWLALLFGGAAPLPLGAAAMVMVPVGVFILTRPTSGPAGPDLPG